MNSVCFGKEFKVRFLVLISAVLYSVGMWGVGFTPTDGGLVVNLKPNDQILLSVMVDHDNDPDTPDREYFVGNYTRYTGDDYFTYESGYYLKLLQQPADATAPADMIVWTVDTALTRVDANNYASGGKNMDYALGGISYTIWNDDRTLRTYNNDRYKFFGGLEARNSNTDKYCDVVFVVPTNHEGIVSFDPKEPNGTMGRGKTFNGRTGTGFMGMTYREVYWLEIPRFNVPVSYTNAAVVTFNTTQSTLTGLRCGDIKSGRAAYAYDDDAKNPKHYNTPRTIFRLYILNEPLVSCPDSYFFAYDEQDFKKYREGPSTSPKKTWEDSTAAKKIYTMDRLSRMDQIGSTHEYQTAPMNVPVPDSSYYYVGYDDAYRHGSGSSDPLGTSTAKSQFTKIRELPMYNLPGFYAPPGAYGRMIADETSSADNLNVKFKPAGYFLKVSTGTNVKMIPNADRTIWTTEEMWTITDAWAALTIKATMQTGPEFSETDPGMDIEDWSEMIVGNTVRVKDTGEPCTGKSGWAQIDVTNPAKNGGMVFIEAEADKYIHYNNNGHFGAQIPDQHAAKNESTVTVQAPRLLGDYEFICWTNVPDTTVVGEFTKYKVGDVADLNGVPAVEGKRVLELYAQARYKGSINVAISFLKEDGKRYFLTHPGGAPRYARARHYDDWTNVRQGIGNADNTNPNYLSSYKIIGKEGECAECAVGEYVLDPKHETMYGAEDSLVFYEDYQPDGEEYLGLYYTNPNVILANTTWAGLFTSNLGWPTPANPCVANTRITSTHYLHRVADVITRTERSNSAQPNVKYMPVTNQFDGVAEAGTDFMISGVGVVDAHYIIMPDTTAAWRDEIVFDYISEPHPREQVWSKLIGKQLLAQMKVGDDTVYFHPNPDKIFTTSAELRMSTDFRLTQSFTLIPDSRVTSVDEDYRATMETADDEFSRYIVGGHESPMNVMHEGNYIDVVDTLRIRLTQASLSKIKDYYGRWKN